MVKLTCNQLMVLLDIYRGTFDRSEHLGSVDSDLKVLEKFKLISKSEILGDEYERTPKGAERVNQALN